MHGFRDIAPKGVEARASQGAGQIAHVGANHPDDREISDTRGTKRYATGAVLGVVREAQRHITSTSSDCAPGIRDEGASGEVEDDFRTDILAVVENRVSEIRLAMVDGDIGA